MNMTPQTEKLIIAALSVTVLLAVVFGGALTKSRATPAVSEVATQTLTNEKHGYSLSYPAGYEVQYPNEHETAIFVGSLLSVEQPRAYINVQDAAGRTTEQVADERAAGFAGFDVERFSVVLDGQAAVVLDNLPGQDTNRLVIVVHDGRLYELTFVPVGQDYGEVYTRMEDLYATVIGSFEFLP